MRNPKLIVQDPNHVALKKVSSDPKRKLKAMTEESALRVYPTVKEAFGGAEWIVLDLRSELPPYTPEWAAKAWNDLSSIKSDSPLLALVTSDGGESVQLYSVYPYNVEGDGLGYVAPYSILNYDLR